MGWSKAKRKRESHFQSRSGTSDTCACLYPDMRISHLGFFGFAALCPWISLQSFAAEAPASAIPRARDTARGLAMYIHAPAVATAGSRLRFAVQAYGYPTVLAPNALSGAIVEAGWETGGAGHVLATATCDQEGRATLELEVPKDNGEGGKADELSLAVSVSAGQGEKSRTEVLVGFRCSRPIANSSPADRCLRGHSCVMVDRRLPMKR
jgi:hypothetical protein